MDAMTTTAQLKDLIAEIEALPGNVDPAYDDITPELSDRVLLAWGLTEGPSYIAWLGRQWVTPSGNLTRHGCNPLNNLQDATLGVPEGWAWFVNSQGSGNVWQLPSAKPNIVAIVENEPARALTLACLRAELARREMGNG